MIDKVTIKVDRPILDHYGSLVSCSQIMEGKVPENHLQQIRGKRMLITGSASSGKDGYYYVNAMEVVPYIEYMKQEYQDRGKKLNPEKYGAHFTLVSNGLRERSYNGLLTRIGKIPYVMVGPEYRIEPVETGIQTQLF